MAKSNFIVRGGADFSGIKQEIDKTQNQFKKFQLNLSSGLKAIGKMAGITLGTAALANFGKQAIKTSSDLEEIQNVTDTVFGSMAKDVDEFSKSLIYSHGIGELSAKKYASYMGAMLKSSGIQGDVMKQMSKDLTLLTADMASFYNLETEEMFQKLMSGMSGATMPLKQLGINMNIANLEAFAMSQGIRKSWQEMSQAEQVMLRYQYLMSVTGDAQGDFARNSWNWAHSVKILGEKWKEFMGIVGRGLQQVILPLIKGLIKVLDILIEIATAIEKVFVMITGKKVDLQPRQVGIVDDYAGAIGDIGDFSKDAAKGQKDLGKGIKDAAKAAKGALMPFDELNILQDSLGSSGGGSSGGLGGLNDINTDFKIDNVGESIADGIQKTKDKIDDCYFPIIDRWQSIRQTLMIPIHVPSPVFAAIPEPIYKPHWNLEIPPLKKPAFPPIPNPVYNPVWNLIPPPVPVVEIPPINHREYAFSLEGLKIRTAESFEAVLEHAGIALETLNANVGISYEWLKETTAGLLLGLEMNVATALEQINTNVSTALNTAKANFEIFKQNVANTATGIATVLVSNINSGLLTMGQNVNTAISTVQNNLQTFGSNVGTIAVETAKSFASNLNEGYQTASQNFSTFANTVGGNLKAFGDGFLRVSAETAQGFATNMVNAFATVWGNFKNLMNAIGERISGWFSANKEVVVKTAITAGVVVGAGALALSVPAAIPYVAGALGGLAAVPALKTGGITDGPMLAMIGDNPGGREVVAPLDDLTNIMASAVGSAVLEAMQVSTASNTPGDNEIVLEIDGTKLARALIPKTDSEMQRMGFKTILQTP